MKTENKKKKIKTEPKTNKTKEDKYKEEVDEDKGTKGRAKQRQPKAMTYIRSKMKGWRGGGRSGE